VNPREPGWELQHSKTPRRESPNHEPFNSPTDRGVNCEGTPPFFQGWLEHWPLQSLVDRSGNFNSMSSGITFSVTSCLQSAAHRGGTVTQEDGQIDENDFVLQSPACRVGDATNRGYGNDFARECHCNQAAVSRRASVDCDAIGKPRHH